MLRIECKCGKLLNVKEELVGKKIKCPACASVRAGHNAQAGPNSRQTASSAGARRKRLRLQSSPYGAAVARMMRTSLPRRKKTAGGINKALLLIGVGTAALLALGIGGAAVWFFVLGNNTSVVDNSANKSKSGSQKPDNPSKSEKAGVAARSDVKPEPPLILAVPAPMASMLDGKDLQSLPADQLLGMANAAEAKGDYARAAPLQFWYAKKSKQGYYNLACYCAGLAKKTLLSTGCKSPRSKKALTRRMPRATKIW